MNKIWAAFSQASDLDELLEGEDVALCFCEDVSGEDMGELLELINWKLSLALLDSNFI
jgi:hypothetical protein